MYNVHDLDQDYKALILCTQIVFVIFYAFKKTVVMESVMRKQYNKYLIPRPSLGL